MRMSNHKICSWNTTLHSHDRVKRRLLQLHLLHRHVQNNPHPMWPSRTREAEQRVLTPQPLAPGDAHTAEPREGLQRAALRRHRRPGNRAPQLRQQRRRSNCGLCSRAFAHISSAMILGPESSKGYTAGCTLMSSRLPDAHASETLCSVCGRGIVSFVQLSRCAGRRCRHVRSACRMGLRPVQHCEARLLARPAADEDCSKNTAHRFGQCGDAGGQVGVQQNLLCMWAKGQGFQACQQLVYLCVRSCNPPAPAHHACALSLRRTEHCAEVSQLDYCRHPALCSACLGSLILRSLQPHVYPETRACCTSRHPTSRTSR